MKRVHFTRKLPKVKVLEIQRGRVRTRYMRLSRVDRQQGAGNSVSNTSLASENPETEHRHVLTHVTADPSQSASKKQKLLEGWERIRHDLLIVRVQEMCPATSICSMCNMATDAIVYCHDCGPMAYYCPDCCTRIHSVVSFHKPMKWLNSECLYVPFVVQRILKRSDGHDCGQLFTSDIVVVDCEGKQHGCTVTLCRCEDAAVTFLRYNLWPATPTNPKIGIDLKFMEILSVMQLECHLPAKSFCAALSCIQLYTFYVSPEPKNIYRAVVGDCLTEYNYHRSSLKSRLNITESTFCRECPICQKEPPLISMDGNFGLVHKLSSGEGHGQTSSRHRHLFFHEHSDLKQFLDSYEADKKSKSTECSNFQAGNLVRSKVKNKKLDITGVFGSVCKHDIPLVFLDMFYGERLGYAVYVLTQVLQNRSDNMMVMYDIAFTLHKHLQKNNRQDILQKCQFAVPVFHSFAHNLACQLGYGQRYTEGTALTDGEGIERLWSYLRGFKKITKEMSVNNREDLLTEALLHHTEKMIWNMASRLIDKMEKAEHIVTDCKTKLQLVPENENGVTKEIMDLYHEWRSDAERKVQRDVILTDEELYAEALHKMNRVRIEMNQCQSEEGTATAEQELGRLQKECSRLKKKCHGMELDLDRQNELMEISKKKRKISSLKKLRSLATERQYLSTLIKKYADGQGVGLRVNRQFAVNTQNMKKELIILNGMLNSVEQIVLTEVSVPSAQIYSELDSRAISSEHQKSVETLFLLNHAQHELANVHSESVVLLRYLHGQSELLITEINFLMEQTDRMSKGKAMFLYHHHMVLENLWETCKPLLSTVNIDASVPYVVHDKVARELRNPFEEINSVLISDILEDIDSEDQILYKLTGADDDDVDDDDDDDDDTFFTKE